MKDLCTSVQTIAEEAGDILMSFYKKSTLEIEKKADKTPVTEADIAASDYIIERITRLTPDIPILCEETPAPTLEERQQWTKYWCIDPLDGTKEFIHQTGEFTINIALIENHQPILSVLHAPALDETFWAIKGEGAWSKNKQLGPNQPEVPYTCLVSRFHSSSRLMEMLNQHLNFEPFICGSALKFARVAQGVGDLYVRGGPTSEWDTAAGQLIVEESGGQVLDFHGKTLQYNTKKDLINPSFIASSTRDELWTTLLKKCTT